MRLRQLAVSGRELEESGIPARMLSSVLRELLLHCAVCPKDNKKERLLLLAPSALHTALERKPTTKAADGFSFYRTGAADCSPVCHPKTPTKSG